MAIVLNLATPDRDSRLLHAASKGTKMAMGDLDEVLTDGAGVVVLDPSLFGFKKVNALQGYGNAGGATGIVFLEASDLAANEFSVLDSAGSPLLTTDLTGKLIHFIALGQ
jgi:hypothetical protein